MDPLPEAAYLYCSTLLDCGTRYDRTVRSVNRPQEKASRAQRRRDDTRERIIKAALELFAAISYEATSMEAIAEAADVARTTVFNHFSRKEYLLMAALSERRQIIGNRLAQTSETGMSTADRIRDAVSQWALSYESDPVVGSALVRGWVQAGGPYLPEATDTASFLADALSPGLRRQEIDSSIDPRLAGLMLFDALIGTLVRWAADPQPSGLTEQSSLTFAMLRVTDMALDGLQVRT
jgi:TetR/AcrR family transcriptional regulator, cholesterol catabolism regulator